MREVIPENLIKLADACRHPLYLVGGSVRDFLLGGLKQPVDWDLASPMPEDELLSAAQSLGFTVRSVYRNTGTVKLWDGSTSYEFTRFRSDKYVRGVHIPKEISFTEDIEVDARRRDFRMGAVYYDIARGAFLDPLGGMEDISRRLLRTVAPAKKVFGEDGLRLMRLSRIAAQTGFSPDEECLAGARENAALILDIAPERIYAELMLLLHSAQRRGDEEAPYRGLILLKETGVLGHILPELALGEGMDQRKPFHDHDVLEHSLRCAMYAREDVKLAALLHDVGKPFCRLRDGNYYAHPEEGARIAGEILTRLKAPKKLIEETVLLVRLHMRDYNLEMKESKVRRELVESYPLLDKLFAVKQADYTACRDDRSPAPGVVKWRGILQKMRAEGAPLSLSELEVDGNDLLLCGVPPEETGKVLKALLERCALDGTLNDRKKLLEYLQKHYGGST